MKKFLFNSKKNIRLFFTIFLVLNSLFAFISCSKPKVITTPKKENISKNIYNSWLDQNPKYFNLNPEKQIGLKTRILSDSFYNQLLTRKEFDKKNSVQFVIIANKKVYTEIVPFDTNQQLKVWNVAQKMERIKIKGSDMGLSLGVWMQTFKLMDKEGNWTKWLHGESNQKNYGDYYPLYLINHKYAQFGVSNWTIKPGELYEISYDF